MTSALNWFNSLEDVRYYNFDGNGTDLILKPSLNNIYGVVTGYSTSRRSTVEINTYLNDLYGLGMGWSFMFSSIEDGKYLYLSDGNIYEINITDDSGDSNLKDYTRIDLRVEKESGYNNGSVLPLILSIIKEAKKNIFQPTGSLLA